MDYPAIIETPENIIADHNTREAALKRISDFVDAYVPDVETDEGRKEIRSLAYKITKTKTAVDEAGKASMESHKKAIAAITTVKNDVVDRLERLRDKFRKPLTDWEKAEAEREQRRKEIREKLDRATNIPRGTTSADMEARIKDISDSVPNDDDFKEARAYCLAQLHNIKEEIEEDERKEAERKELAAKQAALEAENARIAREREAERQRAEAERAKIEREREAERKRIEEEKAELEAAVAALRADLEAAKAPQPEPEPEPEAEPEPIPPAKPNIPDIWPTEPVIQNIVEKFDISSLPWSSDRSLLEDGEYYLVDMKHGIISGYWRAEDNTFGSYYWRDMEWLGNSWVKI